MLKINTTPTEIIYSVLFLILLIIVYIFLLHKKEKNTGGGTFPLLYILTISMTILMMVSYRYIYVRSTFSNFIFVLSTFFTYLFTYFFIAYILVSIMNLFFYKNNYFSHLIRGGITIFIYSTLLAIFIANYAVYVKYKFHIIENNALIFEFIFAKDNDILNLSIFDTTLIIFSIMAVFVFVFLINLFSKRVILKFIGFKVKIFAIIITLFLAAFSQLFNIYAFYAYSSSTALESFLPFYMPLKSTSFAIRHGFYKKRVMTKDVKSLEHNTFNYPLKPLKYAIKSDKYNVLLIVLEQFRIDMFSKSIMPYTYSLLKDRGTYRLLNHYSNGDNTQFGLFGLLYGVTPIYFNGALSTKTGSLLVDTALKYHYNIQILGSAPLTGYPEMKFTAFINVKFKAYRNEKDKVGRDRGLTNDFLNYLNKHKKGDKFFGFLFYDTPHGGVAPAKYMKFLPAGHASQIMRDANTDPTKYVNLQKNANYFVDHLIEKVIKKLKAKHLYDKTIIVITGDHGEEYNDNRDGIWGHNINFDEYQTHVTTLIHYPHKKGGIITKLTSHQDIVPTILRNNFGVTNNVKDYSTGKDIFDKNMKDKFILGTSYTSYAIITDDNKIFTFYGGSKISVTDHKNRLLKDQSIPQNYIYAIMKIISKFR